MSERERWIVYPLLFLTLGVSLRDKLLQGVQTKDIRAERAVSEVGYFQRLRANEIVAQRVVVSSSVEIGGVVDPIDRRRGVLRDGKLIVRTARKQPIARLTTDPQSRGGSLILGDVRGRPQIELSGGPAGGIVKVFDAPRQVVLGLGYTGQLAGIFASNAKGNWPIGSLGWCDQNPTLRKARCRGASRATTFNRNARRRKRNNHLRKPRRRTRQLRPTEMPSRAGVTPRVGCCTRPAQRPSRDRAPARARRGKGRRIPAAPLPTGETNGTTPGTRA